MTITVLNNKIDRDAWTDAFDVSGIDPTTSINIQNIGKTDLYYSVSETQPTTLDKYRIFKRGETITPEKDDPLIWLFSPQADGLVNVSILPEEAGISFTAFGDVKVAEDTPLTQISAAYGLLGQVLTVSDSIGSGTNTVENEKFTCKTGVSVGGFATILSLRQVGSRMGQGSLSKFDAVFTTPVADSQQAAGLITSENSYVFAYLGTTFGIAHTHNGKSEIQELTITTPAGGAENASITVDGTIYTVPLTAGSVQHNAFEIANSLQAQVPNYNFSSNNDQVVSQSLLSGPQGSFAFSSSTAIAAWVQQVAGVDAIIDFTAQTSWNVDNRLTGTTEQILDPTLGNFYQIQICANFGAVRFYLEDSDTGLLVLVHRIKNANLKTLPNVTNPIFRLGWFAQSLGSTTNLTVSGSSAAAFVEGKIKRSTPPRAADNNQLNVGASLQNILAFRNRLTFGDKVNRTELFPLIATASTEANKPSFFEIIANPVFGGDVDWNYVDKDTSLMEIAKDNVTIIGGRVIGALTINPGAPRDIEFNTREMVDFPAFPNSSFAIGGRISSGAAGDMQASGSWLEDT